MLLKEWDWDLQNYVEIDYPDALVKGFIDFLRTTKSWQVDGEIVHRRLLKLNVEFGKHRQTLKEEALQIANAMAAVRSQPIDLGNGLIAVPRSKRRKRPSRAKARPSPEVVHGP